MSSLVLALVLTLLAEPFPVNSLHEAFANRTDDELLALVKANPSLVDAKDDYACTALHYAARYGRVKTAKWLIANKADVNTESYNNFRPMHMAANGDVAKVLIDAGANLTAKDAFGKTPLQNAAQEKNVSVCEVILASDFPIDLASALYLGKRDVAKKMIEEHPELAKTVDEDADLWGNTSPLGIAASQGDNEIVRLLLKVGAPVNAATERPLFGPMTALTNAVRAGHYETAEILCKAGADCNVTAGKPYVRLLDFAQRHSDQKMIDLLIKHGAVRTPDGE